MRQRLHPVKRDVYFLNIDKQCLFRYLKGMKGNRKKRLPFFIFPYKIGVNVKKRVTMKVLNSYTREKGGRTHEII